MSVKISTSNSKLGLIPSVNLVPGLTCIKNAPCLHDCYAVKGRYRFRNVCEALLYNYRAYLSDSEKYFSDIKRYINNGIFSYNYFRWHSSGDIVDEKYFKGMIKIAEELPLTSFLAFTKKFEIINRYLSEGGTIPKNLHIVFSAWGDQFPVNNPYRFPTAYVRFPDKQKNKNIPPTAIECSGDCTNCLQCWNVKPGDAVVFNLH